MNEATLQERARRLDDINKIIVRLDPTIRPAAFALLQDYVTSASSTAGEKRDGDEQRDADRVSFFSKFDHEKPSDNVMLLAAHHYSQFGVSPFTADEIEEMAGEVGITIPSRVDKTLAVAQREGKNLFQHTGKSFRPTVHGEAFFKKTYKVSKGRLEKAQTAD